MAAARDAGPAASAANPAAAAADAAAARDRAPAPIPAPVVIIGAARSGTNMLRDVLAALPGFTTWPCDEIPYVWRHGNRAHPDDEFTRAMASPAARRVIRRAFARCAAAGTRAGSGHGTAQAAAATAPGGAPAAPVVVEKTCANALRVGFVDEVLPEARFVVIVRHGMDAAASAMLRWRSDFDLRYSLAKARWVPWADVPYYAARYAWNRARRLLARDRRLAVWGPVFAGMRSLPRDIPLAELAARQWRRCVERTDEDLAGIDPVRVCRVRYEDFVAAPAAELARILAFLGVEADAAALAAATAGVRGGSVGKAVRSLPARDQATIAAVCGPLLGRHGYEVPAMADGAGDGGRGGGDGAPGAAARDAGPTP